MRTFNLKMAGLTLLVLAGLGAKGDVLYDTFPNYNTSFFTPTNGQTIGNEIFFGSPFTISGFSFEYYSPTATPYFTGNVGVVLRFYANDGPTNANGFATPGTLLYNPILYTAPELGSNSLPANGFHTVNYDTTDFGVLVLPTNFTFTVTFSNLTGGDVMEIPLANPTNMLGYTYGDYWLNPSPAGGWDLLTNAAPASLVASFSGTLETPIPEPSVLGLGAIGTLLMMGAAKLRKRPGKSVKAE